MSQAMDADWLAGRQVAFTGRLASLTRNEAAALIRAHKAEFVASVTRNTAFLIVGQEGWPLRKDGALTHKLQQAHKLQRIGHSIGILSEEDWLGRLGLEARVNDIHQLYTIAQLGRLLRVRRDRLRVWMRAGLVQPAKSEEGVCYFDFQQVTGVKTLCDLAEAGVTAEQIRKSLEQLRSWLPNLERPLAQLALIERDGQLLFRLEEGQLVEPTGQLQLEFPEEAQEPAVLEHATPSSLPKATPQSAEEWWQLGFDQEEGGQPDEAAHSYRQALYYGGPNAELCFNLANVLYELGQRQAAAERFRQALELDHSFLEAWNNLGIVQGELGQIQEALAAYRKALELDPHYGDALYNLAHTLDDLGHAGEARSQWQAYLREQPDGPWADQARARLARIEMARLGYQA